MRFALELKDNLPGEASDARQVPASVVDRSVVNHIYGGNIVIASHAENVAQMAHTNIAAGDLDGLKQALKQLGFTEDGIRELEADIEADKKSGELSLGVRVRAWLARAGEYVGKEAGKAGVNVAKKLATKWILQQFGIDAG